jgi:hypothetical protein
MQENDRLSPKQVLLVQALLAGNDMRTAAKACGVNEATGYRWRKLPHVKQALREGKQTLLDECIDTLVDATTEMLSKHLKADVEPTPASQIAAGRLWFELRQNGQHMRELEDAFEQWRVAQKQDGHVAR